MTFQEARRWAGARVGALDARHLLAWAAGVEPQDVVALAHDPLPEGAEGRLADAVERRLDGWSVAHVTGQALFWGRRFTVTTDVLSPRPETETLIEHALAAPFERFADLGTGSGCIAVSLLAERPQAIGVAVDVSDGALACAARNAERHGVSGRLEPVLSNWWDGVRGTFELVVSNPPYIAGAEMAKLAPEVLREPHVALTPGGDGLAAYRAICAGLPGRLAPGGRILFEIGPTQGQAVLAILRASGLEEARLHPDMDGRDRVAEAHMPA